MKLNITNQIDRLAFCYACLKITYSEINLSKICFFVQDIKNIPFVVLKKYAQVQYFADISKRDCKLITLVGEFDLGVRIVGDDYTFFSGNNNYLSSYKQAEFISCLDSCRQQQESDILDSLKKLSKNQFGRPKRKNIELQKEEIFGIITQKKKYKTIIKV